MRWPPPLLPARVAHVMDIHEAKDLFATSGFWSGLKELATGAADSSLSKPYALALHPQGGLLVTDTGRAMAHYYCWSRQKYIPLRLGHGQILSSPVGIAALPDGRILVADSRRETVECFNSNGKPMPPFVAKGVLERPAGIAVNASSLEVYVADVTQHRVGVFDFQGRLTRWIGRRGLGPGEFNFPTHLAVGADGRLAVADSMNFRIQLLDDDGTLVREIGKLGDAPGQFSKPKGVAIDADGHIIVVEGLYDALQFFDGEGRLLLSLGGPGSGPGEFWLPAGLAVDRENGLLFVADSYNRRIQVFRLLSEAPGANAAAGPDFVK